MARLPEFDATMAVMLADARQKNQVLRYVGRIDSDGKATVGLTRWTPSMRSRISH